MTTTSAKPVRAALYHRVSTAEQNPTAARHALHEAATMRGFTIAMDVEEHGSGARNDRPGLQKIMTAASKSQIDVVCVWKLDRWGRSALDLLGNIRRLEDAGVRFVAVTQSIDLKPNGDSLSRMMVTMLAAVAEFERDLIVERARLGLEKAKREGRQLGRRVSAGAPDPHQVVALRVAGASWSSISAQLSCGVDAARRAAKRLGGKGQLGAE